MKTVFRILLYLIGGVSLLFIFTPEVFVIPSMIQEQSKQNLEFRAWLAEGTDPATARQQSQSLPDSPLAQPGMVPRDSAAPQPKSKPVSALPSQKFFVRERTETEVLASDAVVDADSDGLMNPEDNCPFVANPDQADLNKNGVGDSCEGGPK